MAHTPVSQPLKTSAVSTKSASAFITSLARLIKNSTYYPEGHKMHEQAAVNFLAALKMATGEDGTVVFEVDRDCCLVAGEKISGLSGIVDEMRQLFFDVGFRCIIFHSEVTAGDIQKFIRRVFAWKIEADSAKRFNFFSGEDLPPAIEVYQQQFTTGKVQSGLGVNGENLYDGISRICRALVDSGYSKVDALVCRDFMVQMVEDAKQEDGRTAAAGDRVAGEKLVQLMTEVLDQISQNRQTHNQLHTTDLNTISSIFDRFTGEEAQGAGRQAIDTLLGYFKNELQPSSEKTDDGQKKEGTPGKKSAESSPPEKRRYADADAGGEKSSKEQGEALEPVVLINNFVKENSIPLSLLQQLPTIDRSEEFSILLQLFVGTKERGVLENLAGSLRNILRKRPGAKELRVLQSGLAAVAATHGFAGFYVLAKIVIEQLRVEKNDGLRFVVALAEHLGGQHRKLLWPFLVNEAFLAGAEEHKELFVAALSRAVLPFKEMTSVRPYLERLDVFAGKEEMAEEIFVVGREELYPLYACLLEGCCGRVIGNRLLDTAARSMKGELAFLGEVLDRADDGHFQIVKEYFFSHGRPLPSATVKKVGEVAAAYLSGYENRNENDENLSHVILAAGRFATGRLASFLRSVVHEKRMGVLPLWPPLCRKSAAAVLASVDKRTVQG